MILHKEAIQESVLESEQKPGAELGQRAARLRQRKALTVEEVAEKAKVHKNTVTRFEKGLGVSLTKASKICAALETSAQKLTALELVPEEDYRKIVIRDSSRKIEKDKGIQVRNFRYRLPKGSLNATELQILTETKPRSHRGEEMVFCIEGRVGIRLGDAMLTLDEGEALFFFGTEPHAYFNAHPHKDQSVALSAWIDPHAEGENRHFYEHDEGAMKQTLPPFFAATLGGRAKRIRQSLGLSLRDVADKVGVSKNTVVRFEDEGTTQMRIVSGICEALGLTLLDLINKQPVQGQDYAVRKLKRVKSTKNKPRSIVQEQGVAIDARAFRLPDGELRATVLEIETRKTEQEQLQGHREPGEELLLCLDGTVGVAIRNAEVILKRGDAVLFWGGEPHRYYNTDESRKSSIALSIFTWLTDKSTLVKRRKARGGLSSNGAENWDKG